jgi:hypothetical protein
MNIHLTKEDEENKTMINKKTLFDAFFLFLFTRVGIQLNLDIEIQIYNSIDHDLYVEV